jgi:hypothetical protein
MMETGDRGQAACRSKFAHDSRSAARRARKRQKGRGRDMEEYCCPVCGRWHLSTVVGPEGRSLEYWCQRILDCIKGIR